MARIREDLAQELIAGAKERALLFPDTAASLFAKLDHIAGEDEPYAEDMRAAYAYLLRELPESDLLNFEADFFLAHCRSVLRGTAAFPWSADIKDELFLIYVLMPRVNTEPLTLHRDFFGEALAPRLRGLTLEEAVSECNYYCLSRGTYQQTDGRTVSPFSFIQRAGGRCGEESTFVVSVLRSVGIPARQIYSPYWAHTDDNHAWVEAWTGKRWAYFGACEPEARLNCGWFDGAAKRAKLVLTRSFSMLSLPGEEDLKQAVPAGLINLTGHYCDAKKLRLTLTDGTRVLTEQAVSFHVLNYASDAQILVMKTDDRGQLCLSTAEGSLLLRCVYEGKGYERRTEVGDETEILWDLAEDRAEAARRLAASEAAGAAAGCDGEYETGTREAEQRLQLALFQLSEEKNALFRAPRARDCAETALSDERRKEHERKLAAAQRELESGRASFAAAPEKVQEDDIDMGPVQAKTKELRSREEVLYWARGHAAVMEAFLDEEKSEWSTEQRLRLLTLLSNKDLADVEPEILNNHMEALRREKEDRERFSLQRDEWDRLIFSPRVANENLSAWRNALRSHISAEDREKLLADPGALPTFLEQRLEETRTTDYAGASLAPSRSLYHGRFSANNYTVLLVSLARDLGIPACCEAVSYRALYRQDGAWHEFRPAPRACAASGAGASAGQNTAQNGAAPSETARLRLVKTNPEENFVYAAQYTLRRWTGNGWRFVSPSALSPEREACTELNTDPGIYALNIVRRLENGDQLYTRQFFLLEEGKTQTAELSLPRDAENRSKASLFPDFTLRAATGEEKDTTTLHAEGLRLFFFVQPSGEPFAHLMKELERSSEALASRAGETAVVVFSEEALEEARLKTFLCRHPEIRLFFMSRELPKRLYNLLSCDVRELPLVLLCDDEKRVRFRASGYRVNTDQELLQVYADMERERREEE